MVSSDTCISPEHDVETLRELETTTSGPLDTLPAEWGTIPLHDRSVQSAELLELPDRDLLDLWRTQRNLGGPFDVLGWYRLLYRDAVSGKRILDIGCGFGFATLTFAEPGH